jgi:hypothetical protein
MISLSGEPIAMPQLKIQMTPEFRKTLDRFMSARSLTSEAEAVGLALREALEREPHGPRTGDFRDWIGIGRRAPENPEPRIRSDDDLWG